MNIHEYQSKQLLKFYEVAVPDGGIATNVEQAVSIARQLNESAWVVKAQIHAGARGKAGGVKCVTDLTELEQCCLALLNRRLVTVQTHADGLPVNTVLVEKSYAIKREFYLSLIVDRGLERLLFIASADGGMDIEEIAQHHPERIITVAIHPTTGLQAYQVRNVAYALSLNATQQKALAKIMRGMYELFIAKDASQIEINPLIETADGELIALDAKINFDDNALSLHPDIAALRDESQEDSKELAAQQHDLNYITLEGNIGCMVNGAGLAMATMDLVKLKGGQPANFLDVGGGTNVEKVCEAFKLIVADPDIKAILVNIFGGIVKCDVIASGILAAIQQVHVSIPVVVRLEGTNVDEGRALLTNTGLQIYPSDDLAQAAELVVKLAHS